MARRAHGILGSEPGLQDYAKANGYTVVLDAGSPQSPILFANEQINIGPSATPAVLANLIVNGAKGDGIAIAGRSPASLTNVVSCNAWDDVTTDPDGGSGIYANKLPGSTLNGCAFLNNGRPISGLPYVNTGWGCY